MSIGKQIIISLVLAVPLLMTHASYADEKGVKANTTLTQKVLSEQRKNNELLNNINSNLTRLVTAYADEVGVEANTTLTQEVLSEQRKTNELLNNINSNLTRLVTAQEAQQKEFEYLNTQISAVRTNSRDFEEVVMPNLQDIREILLNK